VYFKYLGTIVSEKHTVSIFRAEVRDVTTRKNNNDMHWEVCRINQP